MKQGSVIPAVRHMKELEKAFAAPSESIFLLEGEIIHLRGIVDAVRRADKKLFVHLDLMKGIKEDEASIHFLAKDIKVNGIISTRASTLVHAKKYGMSTVQRGFMIDSHSIRTIIKTADSGKPDYIELMPCFAHAKLGEVRRETGIDIILGGFVDSAEQLPELFKSGAVAVSTSQGELWR